MIKLRPDKHLWELKNEKNKFYVRWLFIILVFGYFIYVLNSDSPAESPPSAYLNWPFILSLVLFYSLANLFIYLFLSRVEKGDRPLHRAVKYITMIIDLFVVSMVLLPTGGENSMFFLLYIVVIISNTMRYGIKIGIVCLISLNFLYVGALVLLHYPDVIVPNLQTEILKIAGLWAVGIYLGYLSKRFEVMQGAVEKYQKLVIDYIKQNEE